MVEKTGSLNGTNIEASRCHYHLRLPKVGRKQSSCITCGISGLLREGTKWAHRCGVATVKRNQVAVSPCISCPFASPNIRAWMWL